MNVYPSIPGIFQFKKVVDSAASTYDFVLFFKCKTQHNKQTNSSYMS